MKRNILKLKLYDLVYSIKDQDWFQIHNNEQLEEVEKQWGILYCGLELSQEKIVRFWSDFVQKYYSKFTLKFEYIDDDNGEPLFAFFGEFSRKDVCPLIRHTFPEDIWMEEAVGFVQYFPDSTVFKKCYYYQNGKKMYFQYVHELQNLLANCNIGQCIYVNGACSLNGNLDF